MKVLGREVKTEHREARALHFSDMMILAMYRPKAYNHISKLISKDKNELAEALMDKITE